MTNQTTQPNSSEGAVLLDQVRAALLKYVVLPSDACVIAVTLWIAATHGMPAWGTATRLVIKGPQKRCGKTRILSSVEAMSFNALATANISAAAMYRCIGAVENEPPTILIDEADTIFGAKAGENEALRGVLNAGYERDRPTMRWDAKARELEEIPTFAMAALAGIGNMPDTVEDRAVIITMKRRAPGEKVSPYRSKRDKPVLQKLGKQLHKWVRANLRTLQKAEPAMPFEDRAADTWEPLIAIADLAGGHWPLDARTAAIRLIAEAEAEEENNEIRLLRDCQTIFNNGIDFIPTGALLAKLNSDLEAPWPTYAPGGLNPRQLAIVLTQFGIKSAQTRTPQGRTRGYRRNDFKDAWTRYLGDPQKTRATCATRDNPLPERAKPGTGHPKHPSHNTTNPSHQPICLHCAQPYDADKPHQCNQTG